MTQGNERLLSRPELEALERARMLGEANKEMEFSLQGEWAADLAKARYADVIRYQPGINSEVCRELHDLSCNLATKAQEDFDRPSRKFFDNEARVWKSLWFFLNQEKTRVG